MGFGFFFFFFCFLSFFFFSSQIIIRCVPCREHNFFAGAFSTEARPSRAAAAGYRARAGGCGGRGYRDPPGAAAGSREGAGKGESGGVRGVPAVPPVLRRCSAPGGRRGAGPGRASALRRAAAHVGAAPERRRWGEAGPRGEAGGESGSDVRTAPSRDLSPVFLLSLRGSSVSSALRLRKGLRAPATGQGQIPAAPRGEHPRQQLEGLSFPQASAPSRSPGQVPCTARGSSLHQQCRKIRGAPGSLPDPCLLCSGLNCSCKRCCSVIVLALCAYHLSYFQFTSNKLHGFQ